MTNKDLITYLTDKAAVGREELIARFGGGYEVPPREKLASSYIAARIARGLASARDSEGRRRFLAKRGKDGTQFINIDKCRDITSLRDIKGRVAANIDGQKVSLDKVKLRIKSVRQMSLSDLPPDGGEGGKR